MNGHMSHISCIFKVLFFLPRATISIPFTVHLLLFCLHVHSLTAPSHMLCVCISFAKDTLLMALTLPARHTVYTTPHQNPCFCDAWKTFPQSDCCVPLGTRVLNNWLLWITFNPGRQRFGTETPCAQRKAGKTSSPLRFSNLSLMWLATGDEAAL